MAAAIDGERDVCARAGVLGRVLDRLADAVEDRFLDRRRVAAHTVRDHVHAHRRDSGERPECLAKTVGPQLVRIDAVPERAQLVDRRFGLLDDLVEPCRDRAGAGLISRQPELDLDRDQPPRPRSGHKKGHAMQGLW